MGEERKSRGEEEEVGKESRRRAEGVYCQKMED